MVCHKLDPGRIPAELVHQNPVDLSGERVDLWLLVEKCESVFVKELKETRVVST